MLLCSGTGKCCYFVLVAVNVIVFCRQMTSRDLYLLSQSQSRELPSTFVSWICREQIPPKRQ